jgi:succinate dehydrogenase hydrophobic anchor subunit
MLSRLVKMFNQGFLHWFTQRVSACFLIITILFVVIFNNLFLGFMALLFLLIHFESGIHTIFSDYMHDIKSKLTANMIIDISIISLTKTLFIVLICI